MGQAVAMNIEYEEDARCLFILLASVCTFVASHKGQLCSHRRRNNRVLACGSDTT